MAKVIIVIMYILSVDAYSGYIQVSDFDRPNLTVLELQLKENESLIFGEVVLVEMKKQDLSETLKGFKYFIVKMKVEELWSKKNIKAEKFYSFEFGTMVDENNIQSSIPIKHNEKIAVMLNSYDSKKIHVLKDNLLNVYEHYSDSKDGKEYFISKLTKHYSQKNLSLGDLQRIAFNEKMHVYEMSNSKKQQNNVQRSIASEASTPQLMADYESENQTVSNVKRRPNSSYSNKEEEQSVFGLLIVLIFLGIFSHFVIKYYEDPEEEL